MPQIYFVRIRKHVVVWSHHYKNNLKLAQAMRDLERAFGEPLRVQNGYATVNFGRPQSVVSVSVHRALDMG